MTIFIRSIFQRFSELFDIETLSQQVVEGSINLLVAAVTLGLFYVAWRVLERIIDPSLRKSGIDKTSAKFLKAVIRLIVFAFGLLQALSLIGINMAAILTSLGVVGITVGFAAQDSMSNLISGLLIFWDRPFVIDDLVEIDGFYGRVETITLRSTRVVTLDGKMLAIPNSRVINSTVISYSNFPNLRLDIDVTVAVHENIDRVKSILLELVANNSDYMNEPDPKVVVTALNDYNVALQLQVWLINERIHIGERFKLRERVFKTLTEAGVDMPFETLQLTPVTIMKGDRQSDDNEINSI